MQTEEAELTEFDPKVQDITGWIKAHSINIEAVDPERDQADLSKISDLVGSAKLVGLGEATHGSKEFFQIKHRLIRFLVEKMGFDTVVMECPKERAKSIDEYIKTDGKSRNEVLNGLTYEVWRTQEVLDLINWLREFNEKSDRKVSFYGCDVNDQTGMTGLERDQQMAENVLKILEENPDSKIALWAHNAHVGYADTPNFKALGGHLKGNLGDNYISFGMIFDQGKSNARVGNFETGVFGSKSIPVTLKSLPFGSYEYFFAQAGLQNTVVDLRPTRGNSLFSSWRDNKFTVRELGWAYDPGRQDDLLSRASLADAFDGVVWIDTISPSHLLNPYQ